jgi:malic enzyme
MKLVAAHAIAELVTEEELNEEYIIPKALIKE